MVPPRNGRVRRRKRSDLTWDRAFSIGGLLYFAVGGKVRKAYMAPGAWSLNVSKWQNWNGGIFTSWGHQSPFGLAWIDRVEALHGPSRVLPSRSAPTNSELPSSAPYFVFPNRGNNNHDKHHYEAFTMCQAAFPICHNLGERLLLPPLCRWETLAQRGWVTCLRPRRLDTRFYQPCTWPRGPRLAAQVSPEERTHPPLSLLLHNIWFPAADWAVFYLNFKCQT